MTAPRVFIANPFFDEVTRRTKDAPGPVSWDATPVFGPTRIFPEGRAPEDAVPGYLLYGAAPELPEDFLSGQVGIDAVATIHCWAVTKPDAERLAQWTADRLTATPFALAGHDVDLVIRKGGAQSDPSGKAFQVPLNIEVHSVQHA